jgi:L-malate glycosyltransferase
VLVPARLHPMKGHVDLLAALVTLRRHVPDVLVVCAGDGPLRAVLPALAQAAGLADNVRFLGQRSDMPALLGACDVVALPSHIEGLPSVIMEAFAAERAVVATDVGGVPEIVEDDATGWLVPPRVPHDLADALADALVHPTVRAARAARARQVVLDRFQAPDGARHLQAVYDRWMAETDGPRRRTVPAASAASSGRSA